MPSAATIRSGVLLLSCAYTVKITAFDIIYGLGYSMEPTIPDGAISVVDRLSPHWRHYERGDVVLLRSPTRSNGAFVIKRILALVQLTVRKRKHC